MKRPESARTPAFVVCPAAPFRQDGATSSAGAPLTFDSIRKRLPVSGLLPHPAQACPYVQPRRSMRRALPLRRLLLGKALRTAEGRFFSHRQRVKTSADAFASSPPSLRSPPAPCARPAGGTRQTRPAGADPYVRQARKRRTEAQSFVLQQCRASFPATPCRPAFLPGDAARNADQVSASMETVDPARAETVRRDGASRGPCSSPHSCRLHVVPFVAAQGSNGPFPAVPARNGPAPGGAGLSPLSPGRVQTHPRAALAQSRLARPDTPQSAILHTQRRLRTSLPGAVFLHERHATAILSFSLPSNPAEARPWFRRVWPER